MHETHISGRYHYSAGWGEAVQSYVATCAEFRGLTTQSDTAERAINLLKHVVRDIVDGMLASGEEVNIPEPIIVPPFEDCT